MVGLGLLGGVGSEGGFLEHLATKLHLNATNI